MRRASTTSRSGGCATGPERYPIAVVSMSAPDPATILSNLAQQQILM